MRRVCSEECLSRESHLLCVSDCDVCPKLKETIALFVAGDYEDYMAKVRENNSNPFIQDSLQKLKICMDRTLTQEDMQNALNIMVGQPCVSAPLVPVGELCSGQCEVGSSFPLHHGPSVGIWGKKNLVNQEVERLRADPTGQERIG